MSFSTLVLCSFSAVIVASFLLIYLKRAALNSRQMLLARIAFGELIVFALMGISVAHHGGATVFDQAVAHLFFALRGGFLNGFMYFMTWLFDAEQFIALSLALLLMLLFTGRFRESAFASGALFATYLSDTLTKNIFHIARPTGALVRVSGWSFPSGHTAMATTFFLLFFLIAARRLSHKVLRVILLVVCLCGALAVGASRMYLGVHWFSDIVGGLLLGSFWVFLFIPVSALSMRGEK